MPGGPVADAVFADLEPRIKALLDAGHTIGLGTILVGSDGASAGYIRMKQEKAVELGHDRAPRPPARRRHPGRRARRHRRDERRPRGDGVPRPAPHARRRSTSTPRSWPSTPTRTSTASTPSTWAAWRWACRAPCRAPRRASRRCWPTTRSRVAGRDVCILGRGTTLGRPLALLLSQKRPTANAAVTVVHTGVPDWPEYTKRADIVIAAAGVARHPPARAPHARAASWSAGGVRYEGRKLLPGRRRALRGGGRLDHAPRRRGGPHHDRHALPQLRRGGRAPSCCRPDGRHAHRAADRRDRRPQGLRLRLRRPPDADHDPAGGRPRAGPGVGRRGSGRGGRLLRRHGRRVAHPHVARTGRDRRRRAGPRPAPRPGRRPTSASSSAAASARTPRCWPAGGGGCSPPRSRSRCCGSPPPRRATAVLADGSVLPLRDGSASAVVLVNCFLFPAEVDRVLRRDGVVVWVNSSGGSTPIHLTATEVVTALPGQWEGVAAGAGEGTWCVLRRSPA